MALEVWIDGRDFTFEIPDEPPKLIELEVFNSNTFVDATRIRKQPEILRST